MHWRIKGTVQKVLGAMPGGERVHYWLQKAGGGLRNFGAEFGAKFDDCLLMIGHLRSAGVRVAGTRFLEIGTGWYPTFPLCLHVLGARQVDTFDLSRHLKPDLVRRLVHALDARLGPLADACGLDETGVRERFAPVRRALLQGASLDSATGGSIRYRAPADAARTGFADAAVDVVFSNSVLEHVPRAAIERLFAESRRILATGGVMFHSVNCGDHYAYADRTIDQLHYLQFSDAEWARWNNAFLYQNRLRARDFTQMAVAAGFAIEIDTSRPHPERLRQLERIRVHPEFAARYPRDQLAITSIDFVARRAPGTPDPGVDRAAVP